MKNGDRWTILNLTGTGGLRVRHVRNGRTVTLPAGYVSTATELGYATTVHTAQGVTADTMHGVVTGEESRQQLYTMLTRGRTANHIYVSVVGDGDPHTVIQPDSVHLRTATELLEQILARDAHRNRPPPCSESSKTPPSGSAPPPPATSTPSTSPPNTSPATAELPGLDQQRRPSAPRADRASRHGRPCAATCCSWPPPAPIRSLNCSPPPQPRDLTSAHDQAAVIDSRIQDINEVTAGGPLPWLPGIPDRIAADPNWGPYLNARSQLGC